MLKKIITTGTVVVGCTAVIFITNSVLQSPTVIQGTLLSDAPVLGACSINNEELYQLEYNTIELDNDVIDLWSEQYHSTIEEIVKEQLDPALFTPECDAEDFSGFLEPTPSMQAAVDSLNFFKDNEDTNTFSRLDVGVVLLELLRSYECALQERSYFLLKEVSTELANQRVLAGTNIGDATKPILVDIGDANLEYMDQQEKIARELRLARPALERTIRVLNGRERTKILKAEVECLQRVSLDIRNATGLAAEANSCLPRIWNSRDALRDFNER